MHFTDFNHRPERRKANTFGALGYYRTFKPSQIIKGHQVDVVGTDIVNYGSTFEKNWENIFKKYDIVWIMHFLNEQNAAAQAFFANKYKKKLIYDIDDNYLDVPESNPVHKDFAPTKRNRSILSASFFFADALTVSTEPLKDRLQAHFRHVHDVEKPMFVVPNMNDVNDWNFKTRAKHKDKIVIGYSGSNSHKDDLRMFFPILARLMKQHDNLYFEFIGSIPKEELPDYLKGCGFTDDLLGRIAGLPATATFWEYPQYLAQQRWDIGVAPLVDSSFTRCKSHIKWLEYSMYKIPCVASRVYPYFMELEGRQTITDGETGYLATTPQEWEDKLEALIESKELRERIGQQSYTHVKDNWQYNGFYINRVVDQILKLPKK